MTTRERAKRVPEPAKRKRRQSERGKAAAPNAGEPASKEEEGFLFDPYWDDVFAAYFDPTLRVCCLIKY